MLYKILLTLLILDAFILIVAIFLQSGSGGGMAAAFGGASSSSDSVFGTRQAGNLLTKASWWCGGIFIGLAYILQLNASHGRLPTSVLDKSFSAPPVTTPTAPPGSALPGAATQSPTAPSSALPGAAAKPDSGSKAPATKKP
ncbi:MAG TPA: preprotein translocase subunit SecG [Gemmatimonadaceae bacterium]|jgi:preprotein translocase subunit SecG